MSRRERTGWRDEAFSRWHRGLEPEEENHLAAIDGDWIPYCGRCFQVLAFFELCADITRTDKRYAVTRNAALACGVPAWCILYTASPDGETLVAVRAKKIAPQESKWVLTSPDKLEKLIRRLHAPCPFCGFSPAVQPGDSSGSEVRAEASQRSRRHRVPAASGANRREK